VHLDYKNFAPTGRGWLRFEHPESATRAVKLMRESVLAAHPIRAQVTSDLDIIKAGQPFRARGEKGRAEAAERGLLTGNGPDAKVKERGTNVYLWGLPGTTLSYDLIRLFDSYGLRVTAEDEQPVRQIFRYVTFTLGNTSTNTWHQANSHFPLPRPTQHYRRSTQARARLSHDKQIRRWVYCACTSCILD
jgi:RNA recognition motif-containing protein